MLQESEVRCAEGATRTCNGMQFRKFWMRRHVMGVQAQVRILGITTATLDVPAKSLLAWQSRKRDFLQSSGSRTWRNLNQEGLVPEV